MIDVNITVRKHNIFWEFKNIQNAQKLLDDIHSSMNALAFNPEFSMADKASIEIMLSEIRRMRAEYALRAKIRSDRIDCILDELVEEKEWPN